MIYPCQKAIVSFQKLKEIGAEGKNSKVYLAHDKNIDGQLVIKEIEYRKDNKTIVDINTFYDEARKLFKSSHPNVVQLYYACEDDTNIYIAMPYYKNGTIKSLLSRKYLMAREIIKYAVEFLSGLHNIHSKGLIHFDIKPDNIMLSDRNEAMISDFGLTQLVNDEGVASISSFYTKIIPPEVIDGLQNGDCSFDRTYDIYQVGVTLYRMCCGDTEFYSQWQALGSQENFIKLLKNGKFPNRNKYLPHIPDKLQKVVNKCMHPDPSKRYQSALDIINAIADIDSNLLDWSYEVTSDIKKWKKVDKKGILYELEVDKLGSSIARKTTSKTTQRISDYCTSKITDDLIISFLDSID
ncbi:serine/threonine-protein kinase [Acinetobacter baumannii]|uniref:serine/threonine-protein kinase n=1 Tax=Acinetobacter baumannii TaxID=470 RepID=UPI0008103FAC|nr:serine/threonine-protein kinase [Acinetobacter baumannii]MDC5002093.1 serine/threonine protein kinase [Acinetobacter baumannii]MDC5402938.1 serine/threonine protein kinase [Acinetobacter baumannii]